MKPKRREGSMAQAGAARRTFGRMADGQEEWP